MLLIISLCFIIIGFILFLSKFITRYFNNNYPKEEKKKSHNFAILIPARDEHKVITKLLDSISKQTYKVPLENVYVIVEDKNDPTIEICKGIGANYFIRKKLNLNRKGYALMEVIEDITSKKEYDAYFVFDADNVLDKDYFKEMVKTYDQNYDIGIGYRNIKNKDNSIAVSSALIFTIINVLLNRNKSKYSLNCDVSGTGFYITGKVINKLKTYPFNTFTEDYELSIYACINSLTTFYNDKAIFYDEQPTTFKQYFKQRTRWVKGYFETRRKYIKELFKAFKKNKNNRASIYEAMIGIFDILFIVIGVLLLIIDFIIIRNNILLSISLLILFIYLILAVFTMYLLHTEKRFKVGIVLKIKTILMHPLLLFTYVLCLIKVIFVRNIKWDKIEHNHN